MFYQLRKTQIEQAKIVETEREVFEGQGRAENANSLAAIPLQVVREVKC
jgi:hypothetical protein